MVERHFLAVPRGCLQFVIVVFPDHTHLLFLFELKFSGKTSEEKYAASLGTKAKQFFKYLRLLLEKMSKAQRFNFTYRAYGKRSYKNNNNKCKYK